MRRAGRGRGRGRRWYRSGEGGIGGSCALFGKVVLAGMRTLMMTMILQMSIFEVKLGREVGGGRFCNAITRHISYAHLVCA